MAGRGSSPAGELESRFPVNRRQRSLPDNSSSSGRLDVLTVKTPLLPRKSGINMESAKSYGADMEKHSLATITATHTLEQSRPQRSSRSALKWVAGLSLVGAFSFGIFSNLPVYQRAKDITADFTRSGTELFNRQSSSSTSQCDDTSNCTTQRK